MKEKLRASFIHLLISTFVITTFYFFIVNTWYPAPYFQVSGLVGILLLLVGIDLVLGPLLTFIVFKKNKPSLKLDLSVIASIQIIALCYGIYTVYNGHPVYVAYAVDRFTLVTPEEVNPKDAKYKDLIVSTFGKPKIVYAKLPDSPEERNKLLFSSAGGGKDIEHYAQYYEPIENYTDNIRQRSISVENLLVYPDAKKRIEAFLSDQNKLASEFSFLPLLGRKKAMLWALDNTTGEPIAALDIDPWEPR